MAPVDKSLGGRGEPASNWYTVAPNDNDDLPVLPRAIFVGGGGVIRMSGSDGNICFFTAVSGQIIAARPYRIYSTGTTATGLVALY